MFRFDPPPWSWGCGVLDGILLKGAYYFFHLFYIYEVKKIQKHSNTKL